MTASADLPPDLHRIQRLLGDLAGVVATSSEPIRRELRRIADAGGAISIVEYYDDLIAGQESRTDLPWLWLLQSARSALAGGWPELAATIGHFVEFTNCRLLSSDAVVDLADSRLWPMSPTLLAPFAEVSLRAVSSVPAGWRLVDGSGSSIDAERLLRLWSLAAEEIDGLPYDLVAIAMETRLRHGLTGIVPPENLLVARQVRRNARIRAERESAERATGFAGSRDYAVGLEFYARDAYGQALPHFVAAAAAGHKEAALQGGISANEVNDKLTAFRLFSQAASAGDLMAASQLAFLLFELNRTTEAHDWFQYAAAGGETSACLGLAVMALDRGDTVTARKALQQGAEGGNKTCMAELTRALINEAQETPEPRRSALFREAVAWGEKGGQLGDADCMFFAGSVSTMLGDREKGRNWLMRAHRAGNADATAFLRRFLS